MKEDFDRQIAQSLSGLASPDATRFDAARKEILHMYDEKLHKAERHAWMWILASSLFGIVCLLNFDRAGSTKSQILYALGALACLQTSILIKLWYWIVNNKLGVLKEIKQLELQIAELAAQRRKTEEGAREV